MMMMMMTTYLQTTESGKIEDSQAERPSQSVSVQRAGSTLDCHERSVKIDTRCHSPPAAVAALRLRRHLPTSDQQSFAWRR